jgi:hypothetical protein
VQTFFFLEFVLIMINYLYYIFLFILTYIHTENNNLGAPKRMVS